MREMQHENLMKHEQDFEEDGRINIIMEYCEGFTLVELIEQRDTIDEALTQKIVAALLRGLEHLHSNGVAHRDIKCENIICNPGAAEDTKIVDFGFAKPLGPNNQLSDLCGSPSYVAPEILEKQPYNTQCDLWSLGVVMFACLFGQMPFA